MWLHVWLTIAATTCSACAQQTYARVQQNGGSYEWGWEVTPLADGADIVNPFYIQQTQLVEADRANLGVKPLPAASQLTTAQLTPRSFNATPAPPPAQLAPSAALPPNFVLFQQYSSPELLESLPNPYIQYGSLPQYFYSVPNNGFHSHAETQHQGNIQSSNTLSEEVKNERKDALPSVVQVFKNSNCSKNKLRAESSTYSTRNINGNFGAKDLTPSPLTFKAAVNFRVEKKDNRAYKTRVNQSQIPAHSEIHYYPYHPVTASYPEQTRSNARSERYYYTTAATPAHSPNSVYYQNEGINKLVASTKDLITNEDLLKINHAAEKSVNPPGDDVIKAKSRFINRQPNYDLRSESSTPRITVKAHISRIVDSSIEHTEGNQAKEQVLQTTSDEYKFASPIVVQDTAYTEYKNQIVNNLVSTMVPYLEGGYEIHSVRNSQANVSDYTKDSNENNFHEINVTPRPIGQRYLAPITVGLRLLNANDTEVLNVIDDAQAADSEHIPNTVSPVSEKTTVEIQPSIPLDITHINAVEVHEYMDEGRSNNNQVRSNPTKSFYKQYLDYIASKKKNADQQKKYNENDSKDGLEPSENVQSEVEVRAPGDDSNERSEYIRDYYQLYQNQGSDHQKIIQPIIIEKEVPVTKFVDRFIEKPYPTPVEVVREVEKQVPVPVPVETFVEKPYEVTRLVDKPYPVEVPRLYPVPIEVPYPVHHKVFIDRPVAVPIPIHSVVEKQVVKHVAVPTPVPYEVQVPVEKQVLYPVPVKTPVPYPVEVDRPVPVEKVVHKEVPVPYPVEKKVPYPVPYETKVPVPYPVEKRIPYPVDRIVEKQVPVTKYVEKPVHIQVPYPEPVAVPVHVPKPYPVDIIVEKKVPYPVPVDRIVEKKVPVQVPYPVETIVEKIVEKPVVVTKYVDKYYPVETKVPYPVEKIVEKKVPYKVEVPVEVKVPYAVEKIVERPVHIPIRVPFPVEKIVTKEVPIYQYGMGASTVDYPQLVRYSPELHRQGIPPPHVLQHAHKNWQVRYAAQYQQFVRDQHYAREQAREQHAREQHAREQHAREQHAREQHARDQQLAREQHAINQQHASDIREHQRAREQYHQRLREQEHAREQYIIEQTRQIEHAREQQKERQPKVISTHWGFSDSQPLKHQEFKKSPQLASYLSYVTNSQNYFGPPPVPNDNSIYDKSSTEVELKLRRQDRTPKVNIEYGGFKPPLIPSTEVDLDGVPIKKHEQT